jgi:hypothetical protein
LVVEIGRAEEKIQDVLTRLKQLNDPVTVLGQGGAEGAPYMIKKYSLEFGLPYMEYNASYTGKNMYSAMPEVYYGKKISFFTAYSSHDTYCRCLR